MGMRKHVNAIGFRNPLVAQIRSSFARCGRVPCYALNIDAEFDCDCQTGVVKKLLIVLIGKLPGTNATKPNFLVSGCIRSADFQTEPICDSPKLYRGAKSGIRQRTEYRIKENFALLLNHGQCATTNRAI
jgi:hypothetical protein